MWRKALSPLGSTLLAGGPPLEADLPEPITHPDLDAARHLAETLRCYGGSVPVEVTLAAEQLEAMATEIEQLRSELAAERGWEAHDE